MFLQHLILDLFFDIANYVDQNKKNLQIIISVIILGASFGYAGAKIIPLPAGMSLDQPKLNMQANLLSATETVPPAETSPTPETVPATTESVPPVVEIAEAELQEIYTQVITKDDPEICKQKLTGTYIDDCLDYYWNMKASMTFNPELCANIKNEGVKTECNGSVIKPEVKAGEAGATVPVAENNLSDEIIQKKSEECMKKEGGVNQNVCWNSLFLSVAINNADPTKCDSIKDEKTKGFCKSQSKIEVNLKLKKQAITAKDKTLCDGIDDEKVKKDCVNEVVEKFLEVSDTCDQTCTDKKIEDLALESVDIKLCNRINSDNKIVCQNKVLVALALARKDSRVCDQITVDAEKQACAAQIKKEEDINPAIQKELYQTSERAIPQIGESLSNPLTDSPYYDGTSDSTTLDETSENVNTDTGLDENVNGDDDFSSVLDELKGLETTSDAAINTDVCKIYDTNPKQKIACEDALVLQLAIPNKDIAKCKFVQDEATRDYCELEIIGQDAAKAAEEAKQKCYALSSATAQQKCLKSSGFFTEDVKSVNASECLDYADPLDRIACMRKIKK